MLVLDLYKNGFLPSNSTIPWNQEIKRSEDNIEVIQEKKEFTHFTEDELFTLYSTIKSLEKAYSKSNLPEEIALISSILYQLQQKRPVQLFDFNYYSVLIDICIDLMFRKPTLVALSCSCFVLAELGEGDYQYCEYIASHRKFPKTIELSLKNLRMGIELEEIIYNRIVYLLTDLISTTSTSYIFETFAISMLEDPLVNSKNVDFHYYISQFLSFYARFPLSQNSIIDCLRMLSRVIETNEERTNNRIALCLEHLIRRNNIDRKELKQCFNVDLFSEGGSFHNFVLNNIFFYPHSLLLFCYEYNILFINDNKSFNITLQNLIGIMDHCSEDDISIILLYIRNKIGSDPDSFTDEIVFHLVRLIYENIDESNYVIKRQCFFMICQFLCFKTEIALSIVPVEQFLAFIEDIVLENELVDLLMACLQSLITIKLFLEKQANDSNILSPFMQSKVIGEILYALQMLEPNQIVASFIDCFCIE